MTLLSAIEAASDVLGGSTQWVVSGSVGAALVTRADAATLVWVVGSLFNAVFSKILKKGINQVCPTPICFLLPLSPQSGSVESAGLYVVTSNCTHCTVQSGRIPGLALLEISVTTVLQVSSDLKYSGYSYF